MTKAAASTLFQSGPQMSKTWLCREICHQLADLCAQPLGDRLMGNVVHGADFSAGFGCRREGKIFYAGDVAIDGDAWHQVDVAVQSAAGLRVMAFPLEVVRREGRACVLRRAASRALLDARGESASAWYLRGAEVVVLP